MSKAFKFFLFVLLQFMAINVTAAVYEREGFGFINFSGIYNGSMRIEGQFETSVDIINLPLQDVSVLVTSYAFSDGVQTLTQENSEIIRFLVETDENGDIGLYDMAFWRTPITNSMGEMVEGIELSLLPTDLPIALLNEYGFSEPCDVIGVTQCEEVALGNNYGQYIDGGGISPILVPGWNYVSGTPPVTVDANSHWSLLLLAILMLALIPLNRRYFASRG